MVSLGDGKAVLVNLRTGETIASFGGGNATTAATATSIAGVMGNSKIGQGTKTTVGTIMGVINAAEDLAKARGTGKLAGVNPSRQLLDLQIPFTNIGLPFRQMAKKDETLENEGFLEAINLKVQQWASGASLTKAQIDQVNRFTPSVKDTDQNARIKLNNLVNFMQQQIKGSLASEGITYEPKKVDLFAPEQSLEDLFADF